MLKFCLSAPRSRSSELMPAATTFCHSCSFRAFRTCGAARCLCPFPDWLAQLPADGDDVVPLGHVQELHLFGLAALIASHSGRVRRFPAVERVVSAR